ncbi:assimilatory sulfite reductase (NADPH) hemoprotein subunit [Paenibacillus sp. LPE1-1-1.1]|uniref:assimilatory sulfite reductase (NADPH) hemoprotein subunit n=1 Tax=Paenibacillus sp. LPE1-1-1.1 TaxID=3135230 RepID=UPI00341ED456
MAKEQLVKPIGGPPSEVEHIKIESNYLRGALVDTLRNPITGGLPEDDNRLLKFHGSYMQDDRDLRNERERQKLEPAFQFMLRVVLPSGVATSEQWLAMDGLAHKYGNGTLRLTTRQTFQMHGILKWNLKPTLQKINSALMTTLAACGDVNRNVMCSPNPFQSDLHDEVSYWARQVNDHLAPRTRAYHEIWLDGEKVIDGQQEGEVEPIYGPVYLPRKFKIGFAIPPHNDIDVFSQDIGYIAVIEDGKLKGFNISVGGGMGMSHGDTATYPQLGKVIGFCPPERIVALAEKTVMIQRDYGNRSIRKNARFKYTIDRHGIDWFKTELQNRLGWQLENVRPYQFDNSGDRYGWLKGSNGKWNLTLYIQSGRIDDQEGYPLMTGLREIAKVHSGDFRITPNQNLIIGNVTSQKKRKITELVEQYGLTDGAQHSALRRSSISCVSLPTCGLAMAEAERYLPTLIDKLEPIINEAGLRDQEINIRMTGCPNGCARPALGEISFIGKAVGKYNMYMGAGFAGERLNKLYRENIGETEILDTLKPIINQYAKERETGEHFGDFVIRAGYVKAVHDGQEFHS